MCLIESSDDDTSVGMMLRMRQSMNQGLYDELKPGDLFVVVEEFGIDVLVWEGEPDPDPECPEPWDCVLCSGREWNTHSVDIGDIMMFVSRGDEEGDNDEWLHLRKSTGVGKVLDGFVVPWCLSRLEDNYRIENDKED